MPPQDFLSHSPLGTLDSRASLQGEPHIKCGGQAEPLSPTGYISDQACPSRNSGQE